MCVSGDAHVDTSRGGAWEVSTWTGDGSRIVREAMAKHGVNVFVDTVAGTGCSDQIAKAPVSSSITRVVVRSLRPRASWLRQVAKCVVELVT